MPPSPLTNAAIAAGVSMFCVPSCSALMRRKKSATRTPTGVSSRMCLRVGKQHRALRHHVGVEVARGEGRIADIALDEIGLAGALLELARLRDQLVGGVRQNRLAAAHQSGLGEQRGVDVEQAAVRVPRQAVDMAVRSVTPCARGFGEIVGGDPGRAKIAVDRLEQALRLHNR